MCPSKASFFAMRQMENSAQLPQVPSNSSICSYEEISMKATMSSKAAHLYKTAFYKVFK